MVGLEVSICNPSMKKQKANESIHSDTGSNHLS